MKIIVMDYEVQDIQVFEMSVTENVDDLLEKLDKENKISSINNCDWMVVDTLKLTVY